MQTPSPPPDSSRLAFFPAFCLLLIIGTICFRSANDWKKATRWASHTTTVLAELRRVWGSIRGTEADNRAFFLTGERRFPAAVENQAVEVRAGLGRLKTMLTDKPLQLAEIAELERLWSRRFEIFRQARAGRAAGGQRRRQVAAAVLQTAELSTEIYDLFSEIENRELVLLEHRAEAAKRAANRTKLFIVFGGLLAAALLFYARRLTTRRLRENRALNGRLQEAMAGRDAFLATVSHELRTPLHSILGMAASLKGTLSPLERSQCLGALDRSCAALLALVDDILELAKLDAGRMEFFPAPFRLRELVEDCLLIASHRARQKGLALDCEISEATPRSLVGDAKRLAQILTNLLANAVKFTHEGRVTLHVRTEETEAGPRVAFEVQDTGIGIAPDKTGRLFERFHQVDARISREYGGTGLGLTIAKQLTELMAGTIEVRSALGAGSTFTVRLPLPMAEEEHAAEAGPPLPAVAFPLRILVADDVSDNRMLLRLYLRDLAAELIFAKDGLEALAAATQERFDLILLDLHLPRKNGGEVIAALREHEARSGLSPTPVVVVSADEARNTIPGQAQIYFLPKPASRDEVIGAIHRHAQPLSPVARGTARLPESIVYLGQGMRELMPAFLGNRRRDLTNLREYLRLQEHDRLVELCHAFHGVTGSFGFAHASELSRELQLAVQNGELERAGLVVGQIEDFFRETKIVYT